MIYNFDDSLKESEKFEEYLDKYFSRFYEIKKVNQDMQRKGIDRIFISKEKEILIEYKADKITKKTRNVFIETISNDSNFSEGWAVKTQADYIIYHCIGINIYVIPSNTIREKLPEWIEKYPKKTCQNKTYCSYGRLIPIHEIEKISKIMKEVSL